jgi:hypothetical protein
VITLAARWYLRFALSYRDVEDLLTEHGLDVDHVTICRWVQRFTPLLLDARSVPEREQHRMSVRGAGEADDASDRGQVRRYSRSPKSATMRSLPPRELT